MVLIQVQWSALNLALLKYIQLCFAIIADNKVH